jgi:CDP-glucose 4,6-dehydratase
VDERASALEGLVTQEEWNGRRVLVTGHTGFKGAWLTLWLAKKGAVVMGLSLDPPTTPSLHALIGSDDGRAEAVDVRDETSVAARIRAAEPEVVFHLAARSLVRPAFLDPVGTYAVNVGGTVNVLEALRICSSVRAIVVVTSDKVYEPQPDGIPHNEDSPLGGVDPYSSSKAGCELVTAAYRRSYFDPRGVGVATARAGNVVGGGDWAEDRIVPDVVRALERSEPVLLRHPDALRPWQHVLDPLHGYMLLAERLLHARNEAPVALNFGPDPAQSCSVGELVDRVSAGFGGRPGWRVDVAAPPVPETATLRLDASRAFETLGWSPRIDLERGIHWTVDWYQAYARGDDMRTITLDQISAFEDIA